MIDDGLTATIVLARERTLCRTFHETTMISDISFAPPDIAWEHAIGVIDDIEIAWGITQLHTVFVSRYKRD